MKWMDITQIAEALVERYPTRNPRMINFVDLHNCVVDLDGFDDDHTHGGERVLEAIQMAWIEELEE